MRQWLLVLAGLLGGVGLVACAPAGAEGIVHTLAAGSLHAPSGIALDAAGDLFIADTDHCRIVVLPSRSGRLYGHLVTAGSPATVAGGNCASFGYPTGVAVDPEGALFVAEATGARVLMVTPGARHAPVVVAGTGVPGDNGNGLPAVHSQLDEPTGVAVDDAGDLFIADTANCLVRMDPATSGTHDGQAMTAGHLYDVVGTGTCGSADGSPARSSQIWDPVAVAVDNTGDLFIADSGDQTVVEVPVQTGTFYGTPIGAGDAQVVVGVVADGNTPYLVDGLSATGPAAELNDPEGVAVSPTGTLFITDGDMHCIRVVPATTTSVFGRIMAGGDYYTLAGALPVTNAEGAGDGTRWIMTTMVTPFGIVLTRSGSVIFSDQAADQVRRVGP